MSNELVEQKTGGLVSTINQQGLGEMLKPLIKEIHLFDSYVAGTTYLKDQSVLEEIKVDALLEQIRTIDRSRLLEYVGHVDESVMVKVDDALRVSLNLR